MAFREVFPGEDITYEGQIDGEVVWINCVCGHKNLLVGIHKDDPYACPTCRRKFYVSISVKFYCEEAYEGKPGITIEERLDNYRRSQWESQSK